MSKNKARNKRRSFPIRCYVGPNGGGKSLAMVNDVLPSLAAGRRVVSTVRILGPDGNPHPLWEPMDSFAVLRDVEKCDVLLDEVTGVASSRAGQTIPPVVLNLLMQLRRRDVTMSFTAPAWNRAEKVIREVTQAVTLCQGFVPKANKGTVTKHLGRHLWADLEEAGPGLAGLLEQEAHDAEAVAGLDVPLDQLDPSMVCQIDTRHTHDDARLWAPKRLFFWRTYDAFVFDEWTTSKRERVRPVARQLFWRPGSPAEAAYDTLDQVLSVQAVTDSGRCVDCNGTRTAPKCSCPRVDPLTLTRAAA